LLPFFRIKYSQTLIYCNPKPRVAAQLLNMASFFMNLGITLEEAEAQIDQLFDTPFKSIHDVVSKLSDLLPEATAHYADELVKLEPVTSSPSPHPNDNSHAVPSSRPLPRTREDLVKELMKKRKIDKLADKEFNAQGKGIDDEIWKIQQQRDEKTAKLLDEDNSKQEVNLTQSSQTLPQDISKAEGKLRDALAKANALLAVFPPLDASHQDASTNLSLPHRNKPASPSKCQTFSRERAHKGPTLARERALGRIAGYSPQMTRCRPDISARGRQLGLQSPKSTLPTSDVDTHDGCSPSVGPSLSNDVAEGLSPKLYQPCAHMIRMEHDEEGFLNDLTRLPKSTEATKSFAPIMESTTGTAEFMPSLDSFPELATGKKRSDAAACEDRSKFHNSWSESSNVRFNARMPAAAAAIRHGANTERGGQMATLDLEKTFPAFNVDGSRYQSLNLSAIPYASEYTSTQPHTYQHLYCPPYHLPNPMAQQPTFTAPYEPTYEPMYQPMYKPVYQAMHEPMCGISYTSALGSAYQLGHPSTRQLCQPYKYQPIPHWATGARMDKEWQGSNAKVEASRDYHEKRRDTVDKAHERMAFSPPRTSPHGYQHDVKVWMDGAVKNSLVVQKAVADENKITKDVKNSVPVGYATGTKYVTKPSAPPVIKQQVPCVQNPSDTRKRDIHAHKAWNSAGPAPSTLASFPYRNKQSAAASQKEDPTHAGIFIPWRDRCRAREGRVAEKTLIPASHTAPNEQSLPRQLCVLARRQYQDLRIIKPLRDMPAPAVV
jgi:hypothetical protein